MSATRRTSVCDRCGGVGKFYLFSSYEDPCKKCGGTGGDPLPPDKVEPEKSLSSQLQDFFVDEFRRKLSRNELIITSLTSPPSQKDLDDLIDAFESHINFVATSVPRYLLLCGDKPTLHYRRSQNHNSLRMPPQGYRVRTSWNGRGATKQPDSTLIITSANPKFAVVYTFS